MPVSALDIVRNFSQGEEAFKNGPKFTLPRAEFDVWLADRLSLFHRTKPFRRKRQKTTNVGGRDGTFAVTVKYECDFCRPASKKQKESTMRVTTLLPSQQRRQQRSNRGNRRPTEAPRSPRKMRAQEPRLAYNCPCYFLARFPWEDQPDVVEVEWKNEHNHTLDDPQIVTKDRHLSPQMVAWLKEKVAEALRWGSIAPLLAVTRADYRAQLQKGLVYERSLVTPAHVQRLVRSVVAERTRLHPDLWHSLVEWMDRVRAGQGFSMSEDHIPTPRTKQPYAWMVAFSTDWQLDVMSRSSSTLCLDSTHCTCRGNVGDEVYLYSIVVRNPVTGAGVPISFMLTNSAAAAPIARWLQRLRDELSLQPLTVVIDCSTAEADAILSTWPQVLILYCWFHVFQAIMRQSWTRLPLDNVPDNYKQKVRGAIQEEFFNVLRNPTSKAAFDTAWEAYRNKYQHPGFARWTTYLSTTWINTHAVQQRVAAYGRQHDHEGIDTNNYIERWHGYLKECFVGPSRKQRADFLISTLIDDALPELERMERQTELGIVKPRLTEAEQDGRAKAEAIPDLRAGLMVSWEEGRVTVASFTLDDVVYSLDTTWDMEENKLLCSRCSCPAFARASVRCKHMFLASRALNRRLEYVPPSSGAAPRPWPIPLPAARAEDLEQAQMEKEAIIGHYQNDLTALTTWCRQVDASRTSREKLEAIKEMIGQARIAMMEAACNTRG